MSTPSASGSTLFVSDLHLDERRPEATERFLQFLKEEARHARALYILGDLFEFWIGDDVSSGLSVEVADGIADLATAGTPVYFTHGNRDFMLGAEYAQRCCMTLLPEEHVIDLYGQPTLVLHGDQLCTDDTVYQAIRQKVRNPEWKAAMMAKSPAERMAFARQAREQSRDHQQGIEETIMDVNSDAVMDAFARHDVRLMIHGHTHRPAFHELSLDSDRARRIVLSDWYAQGSVLKATQGSCSLENLIFATHENG